MLVNEHVLEADDYDDKIRQQDYGKLKMKCFQDKTLFKDSLLNEDIHSEHFWKNKFANMQIEWLRPSQIIDDPQFIIDQATHFDSAQGKLNDCWLIAAITNLAMRPKLFCKVVPEQSFTDQYAGIFCFNFYPKGKLIQVVIDDLLPTNNKELIFGHCKTKNEFWVPLLEKAYAKLCGSYEALNFGHACEAFVDFTGGIAEILKFKSPEKKMDSNFYDVLYSYYLRNSLICVFIDRKEKPETRLTNGLIVLHEYSLTGMKVINCRNKKFKLIRLRNPWANDIEWNGAWSDVSPEWTSVPEQIRESIGLKKEKDGEFWIDFNDFKANFNVIECCHLLDCCEKYKWNHIKLDGCWDKATAGGCVNNKETFFLNPKFILTIAEKDVDFDDDLCTVIISLSQSHFRFRRLLAEESAKKMVRIGYVIYDLGEVDEATSKNTDNVVQATDDGQFGKEYFRSHTSVDRVDFVEKRANCNRFRFKPGRYLIVPSTFEPGQQLSFELRFLISKSLENRKDFEKLHSGHNIEDDFDGFSRATTSRGQKDSINSNAIGWAAASPPDSDKSAEKGKNNILKRAKNEQVIVGDPATTGNFKKAHILCPIKMKVEKVENSASPSSSSSKSK